MSWLVEPVPAQQVLAERFIEQLHNGPLMVLVGVYDGLSALLARQAGLQQGLYLSGAALSASQGLPDLGMMQSDEVSRRAREVIRATGLPLLVDIDTGYGGVLNVARAAAEMVEAGVAAVQIEDQDMPKKCGHLTGKQLVAPEVLCQKVEMIRKVAPNLAIVARTDARGVEGLDAAVDRARHYVKAGAHAIFVEALESIEEFRAVAQELPVPLLANMTEFGRTPYLTVEQFAALGYRLVIFPVSALRAAAWAMEGLYRTLANTGTQVAWLDRMQTRKDLYALLGYDDYEAMDSAIFKSGLPDAAKTALRNQSP
jgi:methylisocitrate lyase